MLLFSDLVMPFNCRYVEKLYQETDTPVTTCEISSCLHFHQVPADKLLVLGSSPSSASSLKNCHIDLSPNKFSNTKSQVSQANR